MFEPKKFDKDPKNTSDKAVASATLGMDIESVTESLDRVTSGKGNDDGWVDVTEAFHKKAEKHPWSRGFRQVWLMPKEDVPYGVIPGIQVYTWFNPDKLGRRATVVAGSLLMEVAVELGIIPADTELGTAGFGMLFGKTQAEPRQVDVTPDNFLVPDPKDGDVLVCRRVDEVQGPMDLHLNVVAAECSICKAPIIVDASSTYPEGIVKVCMPCSAGRFDSDDVLLAVTAEVRKKLIGLGVPEEFIDDVLKDAKQDFKAFLDGTKTPHDIEIHGPSPEDIEDIDD